MISEKNKIHIILFMVSLTLFWISYDFHLFGDNIVHIGRPANHFYKNGLFNWVLDVSIDTGQPQLVPFLINLGWILVGKSMATTHILYIPLVYGVLYQLFKLCSYFFSSTYLRVLSFALVFVEPTFTTHLLLINGEIFLTFFFLLSINTYLQKNNVLKIIAISILSLVSYRAMLVCIGLFFFELIHIKDRKDFKSLLFHYTVAAIPAAVYILWRYFYIGWISYHDEYPWLSHRQNVDLKGFFRNFIILFHRYLDFGKIILIPLTVLLLLKLKKVNFKSYKSLFWMAFLPVLPVIITSLKITNPMGHRYFLISYSIFIILFLKIAVEYKYFKIVYFVAFLSLIGGNFWIYPKDIAQGWDSSLAHIPYYHLKGEVLEFIEKEKIPMEEIASFSSNVSVIDNIYFNDDNRSFSSFNIDSKYVIYSNVYNLSDGDLEILKNEYSIIKRFEKNRIYVDLLQKVPFN